MDKKFATASITCLLLLASCGCGDLASEYIAKPVQSKAITPFSETESNDLILSCDDLSNEWSSTASNSVISPLSFISASLLKSGTSESLDEFKSLAEKTNVETEKFSLSSLGSIASTDALEESVVQDYNDHLASVFVGELDELENSLNKFYDDDVALDNNGTYYFNSLSVEDMFYIPIEDITDLPFNKQGKFDYTINAYQGKFLEGDNYYLIEIPIYETSLRLLISKEGVDLSSVDSSVIFQSPENEGRIKATIPEFSVEDHYYKSFGERYLAQDSKFGFSRYGIEGSSFTANGPTATSPDFDFDIIFDRPFYFASIYEEIPLFLGTVQSL